MRTEPSEGLLEVLIKLRIREWRLVPVKIFRVVDGGLCRWCEVVVPQEQTLLGALVNGGIQALSPLIAD